MSVTATPRTSTQDAPASDEPDVVLHRMKEVDILNAQVFGIPAVALCGFKFVPASGAAPSTGSGSGAGKTVLCESCDILNKCGVRSHRPRA